MNTGSADQFLGIVEGGQFRPVAPQADSPVRLTRIFMQEATGPETEEIDVSTYEGQALLVKGRARPDWIYEAEILEDAGLILTAVVRQVFARDGP